MSTREKSARDVDTVDDAPSKKLKADDDATGMEACPTSGVVDSALLSQESRETLRSQYVNAEPYTHCVMRQPFNRDLLCKVRDEIINNIEATYKETDLFKVFQTGDLGNLARLDKEAAAKLPALMSLKAALYSPSFRSFIREITGCGELSDKIDCSCNVYADSGHLLCHDDVIGTRRVSWIIYLTDPEHEWREEDGGALELYPLVEGQPHTPHAFPTVCLLPTFNTMAMFTVLPGKSFHAVQEVFTSDKPRMSISGWYHAPHEPEDADKASLQQLQQLKAGADLLESSKYDPFAGGAPGDELCDEDLALLVRYVNPSYLSEDSWPKIQARFAQEGSIQLQNFLKKDVAQRVCRRLAAEDSRDGLGDGARPSYQAGVADGWVPVGPPHKQRYLRYDGEPAAAPASDETSCGALLAQVRDKLFQTAAFARLLRKFTSLGMVGQRSEVRRFRPGLDYTVAHYGILTKDPRLDVVLCFVDTSAGEPEAGTSAAGAGGSSSGPPAVSEDKAAAWDNGEVGGFEAYLLAEEDGDAAAPADTYRSNEDESGVLNVSAAPNSLNLVLRDEGLMKFVKYVSYKAPSSRWDIAMECLPEDDSDDEEEKKKEEA